MAEEKFKLDKDIATLLGVDEEFDNKDAFKSAFNESFIRRNLASQDEDIKKEVTGRVLGSIETTVNRTMKEHGIELSGEDKDKRLEEKIALGLTKLSETHNNTISELNNKIGAPDEALKDLQTKFDAAQTTINDLTSARDLAVNELTDYKGKVTKEREAFELNAVHSTAFNGIKFSSNVNDMTRKGFEQHLRDNYKLLKDEQGQNYIADSAGQRIENPKVVGTFKTIDDVYKEEAIKAELIQTNNHAPNQQQQRHTPQPPQEPNSQPARKANKGGLRV